MVDQINDASQELINLRIENEILHNDLSMEKETNERMMKSQECVNELDRKNQSRHKGTIGLGFIDEGESTLHPNWQKMYIKYIIDFFQKNIQNKKMIINSSIVLMCIN